MKLTPRNFRKVAREEVAKVEQTNDLVKSCSELNDLCDNAMTYYGEFDGQERAREIAGEIRANSLNNLLELLVRFEVNATLNGTKVLWAKDSEEALRLIEQIIKQHNIRTITQSKSSLAEEINLSEYINTKTDAKIHFNNLGDFINDELKTPPFHLSNPIFNLKLEEVVDILHRSIGIPITKDASNVAGYVNNYFRNSIFQADMSITGVNQAIASTGSLLLVDNAGNIRMSTANAKIQVALMSIEKVCDNLGDAFFLNDLLTRNSTGQNVTSYISILNGPKADKEKDGPDELYVIILDNGRIDAYLDEEFREALRCIRCGRCATVCPVYKRIGAYPYGNPYPGPIGAILMPLILGLNETKHLYQACTLCGACMDICPVRVPHLDLIIKYRNMKATGDKQLDATINIWNRMLAQSFARAISKRSYYERSLVGMRAYFNSNANGGNIKNLPGPVQSWFIARDFPPIPEETFRDYWETKGYLVNKEEKKDG